MATGMRSQAADSEQEDLGGPPAVTARAWIVADAAGISLAGVAADEPRKAASTAKIMTALVVLRLVERAPDVLGEELVVSRLAAATGGSTAGLEEGDRLLVGEALYGLLLPSGNDAGNALGEHFHQRLDPPDDAMLEAGLDSPLLASRVRFVAEMNRVAKEIGMPDTVYRSAFGDGGSPDDRTTTATDLVRLARAAMESAAFREIVATPRREAVLRAADGSERKVVWENTNQLLALGLGYDGVKTGVTEQARHCLVASGRRGEDRLFVVVLGCPSSEARFADARNLFRWGWGQRSGGDR